MKRLVFGMLNPSKAGAPPDGDLTVTKVCSFAARIIGLTEFEVTGGGADFSDDRVYRYRLWRELSIPSVPGEDGLWQPVVRVDVVNAFAFISTDPKELLKAADPVGRENAAHVDRTLEGADMLIAAWGSLPRKPLWLRAHANALLRKMTDFGDVHALGVTVDGSPSHPSRLPYAFTLQQYRTRRVAA